MPDILDEIARLEGTAETAVLATIVETRGSTPGKETYKMLVRPDGSFAGTVGGGCLEADVWARGREVLATGRPAVMHFDLSDMEAHGSGLICGGRLRVFVERVGGPSPDVFRALAEARSRGEAVALATRIDVDMDAGPRRSLLSGDGQVIAGADLSGTVEAARAAVLDETARTVEAEGRVVFVEPIVTPTVVIFGAGHVGQRVADLARLVGFRVTVTDDRDVFLDEQRFPGCARVAGELSEVSGRLGLSPATYAVVVTRGHRQDEPCLEVALAAGCRYVGLIGSRAKIARIFSRLLARGFSRDRLAAVRAPVGLAIGARTTEEIALSICAEMVAVRRGIRDTRPLVDMRRGRPA